MGLMLVPDITEEVEKVQNRSLSIIGVPREAQEYLRSLG